MRDGTVTVQPPARNQRTTGRASEIESEASTVAGMPDSARLAPGRPRALVAATDPADVGTIASALGGAGHEIVTAYRVETAVARLVEEAPDYVVICLADRDPELITLIARLHARSDAPILVVTETRDENVATDKGLNRKR